MDRDLPSHTPNRKDTLHTEDLLEGHRKSRGPLQMPWKEQITSQRSWEDPCLSPDLFEEQKSSLSCNPKERPSAECQEGYRKTPVLHQNFLKGRDLPHYITKGKPQYRLHTFMKALERVKCLIISLGMVGNLYDSLGKDRGPS